MIVIEIVDGADVKARGGLSIYRIGSAKSDGRSLMEYLAADGQLLGHLLLQEPAEEPIIPVSGVKDDGGVSMKPLAGAFPDCPTIVPEPLMPSA